MTVVRSSVFTDWQGNLHARRLFVDALNRNARNAVLDLADAALPFCSEHASILWPGRFAMHPDTLTARSTLGGIVRRWAEKVHLGPPVWLSDCIDFSLHAWLHTDARTLLIPEPRSGDSVGYVMDVIQDCQAAALNMVLPHVRKFVSGDILESELVQHYGDISREVLRVALGRASREIGVQALKALGPLPPSVRLSFTEIDADAAVRYQVIGESPDEITGAGRRSEFDNRVHRTPILADPSNLLKMIRELLRAIDISPRQRQRRRSKSGEITRRS